MNWWFRVRLKFARWLCNHDNLLPKPLLCIACKICPGSICPKKILEFGKRLNEGIARGLKQLEISMKEASNDLERLANSINPNANMRTEKTSDSSSGEWRSN